MISEKEAIKIAENYFYENDRQEITRLWDSPKGWIAFGGYRGRESFGVESISISKEDGTISSFLLPSKSNFEILNQSVEVILK